MNIWMNSKSFWPFRQRKRISHDPILPLASSLFYFNSSTRVCIWKERRLIETHCQCLYFLSTNHLHQRTLLLYQAISFLFSSFCIVSFIVVLAFILLLRWWALWDLSMLGGGRGFSAFVVSLQSHFIGQWTFGSRVPLVLLPVFLSLITLRG